MSWNNGKGLGKEACDVEDRSDRLEHEWLDMMPCRGCEIEDVCKYKDIIRRVDYPKDIFNIDISCAIKSNYRTVTAPQCIPCVPFVEEERL